ncbi:MAG: DUF3014 domain-containing protein [Pseudomonadota bacterium]|nr:DUF3014 domain-containing protein [Pseudomonadota bacterium]
MAISPPTRSERAEPRIDPELDPQTGAAWSSAERADMVRTPAPRKNPIAWLVLLMVLAAGAVFYYLWRQNALQPPPVMAPPPQPSAAVETAPAIRHPIEEAQGVAPGTDSKPLPALMVSDTTMQNLLADLFGPASLGTVFYQDAIIHRFVTTIDNLPRKSAPSRNMPVKPIPGPLVASAKDDNAAISAENAARYRPYVRMAEAIDARNLVEAYVHFYPLIQQDYRDLGYPKGYFNDRLIEAIDDLLAAPEVAEPLQVVQPKILYQYADPALEARSAGQKIMIRMGSDNAARVKAKLREIRTALTGPKAANASTPKLTQ